MLGVLVRITNMFEFLFAYIPFCCDIGLLTNDISAIDTHTQDSFIGWKISRMTRHVINRYCSIRTLAKH